MELLPKQDLGVCASPVFTGITVVSEPSFLLGAPSTFRGYQGFSKEAFGSL